VGDLPKIAADANSRGKTLYEITPVDGAARIVDEGEIER
jgi:hypothetical protein